MSLKTRLHLDQETLRYVTNTGTVSESRASGPPLQFHYILIYDRLPSVPVAVRHEAGARPVSAGFPCGNGKNSLDTLKHNVLRKDVRMYRQRDRETKKQRDRHTDRQVDR